METVGAMWALPDFPQEEPGVKASLLVQAESHLLHFRILQRIMENQ